MAVVPKVWVKQASTAIFYIISWLHLQRGTPFILIIVFTDQQKREKSPTYIAWLVEQKALEEFNTAEEQRLAMQRQKQWEAAEELALLRWREQQSRLAQAKAEKFKREVSGTVDAWLFEPQLSEIQG